MKHFTLLLILLLFTTTSSFAMGEGECGTTEMPDQMIDWLRKFQQNPKVHKSADDITYMGILFHIVGRDDGSGYFRTNDAFTLFCNTNEQFAHTNIQFVLEKYSANQYFHYIDNSDYFIHDWRDGGRMMAEHNVDGVINIYIVQTPVAGNCGYFSFGGNAIAVAKGCSDANSSTLSHEIGHYLSLPHTFYGWEGGEPANERDGADNAYYNGSFFPDGRYYKERVQRHGAEANCNVAGDFFCDTPADYIPERWGCNTTRDILDPVGRQVRPDGSYFMSYASDDCQNRFSPQQVRAMIGYAHDWQPEILREAPELAEITLGNPYPVHPAPDAENVNHNRTELVWHGAKNAEMYYVEVRQQSPSIVIERTYVTDTFHYVNNLKTDTKYLWTIMPLHSQNLCGSSVVEGFRTGQEPATLDLTEVYISPVSCSEDGGGSLNIKVEGGTEPYTYQWYRNGAKNTSGATTNFTNLTSANYMLEITDAEGIIDTFTFYIPKPKDLIVNVRQRNYNEAYISFIKGGEPPYSFEWSNGATTKEVSDLPEGMNTVLVTDGKGCTLSKEIFITPIQLEIQQISCFNEEDAYITVNVPDTTADYRFEWNHLSQDTSALYNLIEGDYYLTILRNGVNHSSFDFSIKEPPPLVASVETLGPSAFVDVEGGTAPYSYWWPGATDFQADIDSVPFLPEGIPFQMYVQDAQGCQDTVSFEITAPIVNVGLEELDGVERIQLNPTLLQQQTPLQLNSQLKRAVSTQIAVYNNIGQLMYQEKQVLQAGSQTHLINMDGASTGLYLVKLEIDGVQQTYKVMVVQ